MAAVSSLTDNTWRRGAAGSIGAAGATGAAGVDPSVRRAMARTRASSDAAVGAAGTAFDAAGGWSGSSSKGSP